MGTRFTERDRFLLRVLFPRGGPRKLRNTCWGFAGPGCNRAGHKKFSLTKRPGAKQKHEWAHRYMWALYHATWIPAGKLVRHTCDNPGCVNPRHLVLGTYKQNTQDAVERDRMAHGSRNANARLTEAKAREILKRWKNGERQVDLAREFGVTQAAISLVCTRKNWRRA